MKRGPLHLLASSGPAEPATSLRFFLIFAGMAVGIVAAGYFYYREIERHFRRDAEQQLAAIAQLKVGELVQWRKERLGDGAIQQHNPAFTQLARRCLATPADADARRQLQAWFRNFQTHLAYSRVSLLDAQGVERLASPGPVEPVCHQVAESVAAVLQSGRVTLLDFHREAPDRPIHLSVLVPLLEEADGHRPLGLLLMQIDPDRYLFPFISRWPLPSETAETLLIRREGQEAVFLNELRFKANTALNLRVPVTQIDLPAVQVALGKEGIVEGRDYRGVPVLAAVGSVPDSPWFLVARRDVAEVFAPLRAQLWQIIVLVGGLIFSAGAGVGAVWREQRLRFLRVRAKTAEALHQSEKLLNETGRIARIGGWMIDLATQKLRWTEAVYAIHEVDSSFQPTVEAAVNFYAPESRPIIQQAVDRAIQYGEPFDLELEVNTAKQRRRAVHAVGHAEYQEGKAKRVVGVIQDITERRRAEQMLRENELKFRLLFETTTDAHLLFSDGRWVDCNQAAARVFGCTQEQIMGAHPSQFSPPTQPDGRPSAETAVQLIELAFTGQPQVFEWEHCRLDGTTFAAEVCLNRLDLSGKPYIQAIVRDIAGRKRAEAALAEEKRNLEALFASSPVAMFILDDTTRIVRVNTAAVALSQAGSAEVLEHRPGNALGCVHSLEDPRGCGYAAACRVCATRQGIETLLATGGQLNGLEVPIEIVRHGAVEKVWIKLGAEPIMLDGRRHLIVAMDDITELKTSEQRLRRLRNLLTETEEMGKVGGWEFDIATGHQIWTEEVYRIHEVDHTFDPTVATGIQFYSPASRPVIEQAVQRAIEQGEPFDLKLEIITAKGNHRHVHAIGKADRVQHKVFGFFQDITARQQAETKVAEQLDELLRWHEAMEGREGRVLELKQEINELLLRAGQPVRYASAVGGGGGSEQLSVSSEQSSVSRDQSPVNRDQ